MPRNVELKARVADPEALRRRVEAVADGPPTQLVQTDTFFRAPTGRLKLRVFEGDARSAELIAYARPDAPGPTTSTYARAPVADAAALHAVLAAALGVRGVVRKRRAVYHAGRTRLHLDRVDRLGAFLELEVVLGEVVLGAEAAGRAGAEGHAEAAVADGEREARLLLRRLGVAPGALVARAYLDLLLDAPGIGDPGH